MSEIGEVIRKMPERKHFLSRSSLKSGLKASLQIDDRSAALTLQWTKPSPPPLSRRHCDCIQSFKYDISQNASSTSLVSLVAVDLFSLLGIGGFTGVGLAHCRLLATAPNKSDQDDLPASDKTSQEWRNCPF